MKQQTKEYAILPLRYWRGRIASLPLSVSPVCPRQESGAKRIKSSPFNANGVDFKRNVEYAAIEECIENPPDLLSLSLAGLTDDEITKRRHQLNIDVFYRNAKRICENRKVRREEDGGIAPMIHISTHIYPYEMHDRKMTSKSSKISGLRSAMQLLSK